jgi:hypothetical protein
MTRTLLAIVAALAVGSVSACATTASTGSGATPSAVDGSQPTPTLNDSFHYPSPD